jgi:hypothetical protein
MKKFFVRLFKGQEIRNENVNPNQFGMTRFKGDLDMSIMRSGVITCVVSANQVTALGVNQRVKIDTASGGSTAGVPMPQIIAAGINDVAIGSIKRAVNKSTFSALEACEVVYSGKPVLVEEAGGVIAAGAFVEALVSTTKVVTTGTSTAKKKGWTLDAAAADGDLIRVVQEEALS